METKCSKALTGYAVGHEARDWQKQNADYLVLFAIGLIPLRETCRPELEQGKSKRSGLKGETQGRLKLGSGV
jgi:hypothetical protein